MMTYTPKCYTCEYFIKEILYKNSCQKYKEISKKIILGEKECKYYKKGN